jgi:hypothetical protein
VWDKGDLRGGILLDAFASVAETIEPFGYRISLRCAK